MEEDDAHADKPADYYHTGKYCVKSHTASGDEGRLSASVGNLNGLAVGTVSRCISLSVNAADQTTLNLLSASFFEAMIRQAISMTVIKNITADSISL